MATGAPGASSWLARHGPTLAGACLTIVVCVAPLLVLAWRQHPAPELRVVATGSTLAVLIVDADARILVINAQTVTDARAALGHLTRPWEAGITTLVAPATNVAAPGLLEALNDTHPNEVIVVGAPPTDALWTEIEQRCAARGVLYTVVAGMSATATQRLQLTLRAGVNGASGGIVARRGGVSVLIALGDDAVAARGQALLSNGALTPDNAASVQITSDSTAGAIERVVVGTTAPARIVLEPTRLRVRGGALLAAAPASPTP